MAIQTEFSKEQELLRDVVGRFLREASPPEAVRELMASELGYDPAVWRALCDDAELAGIHLPAEHGGSGFGAIELGIVAEEMGRTLLCSPFFSSSVMAGCALLEGAEDEAKADLLPGIANGSTPAALVLDDLDVPTSLGRSLRVEGGSLTGTATQVVDGHSAPLLIVVADSSEGRGLFRVDPEAAGVERRLLEVVDPTRKLARLSFDGVPAARIGRLDETAAERLWDQMNVALAHEMIGGAQQLFESTVEYTKMRVQFGRPIGSFQALKHRCADLLMEVQLTRSVVHHAARCLDSSEGEPYAASMAKAMAADTFRNVAKAGIQLRGGIGFTWEDDTHLWFKRAKSSEVFLGSPHLHRERMMATLEATS